MKARTNGALGHRELIGDFLEAQTLVVVRDDDVAIARGELVERVLHLSRTLGGERFFFGLIVVLDARQGTEILERQTFDEACAMAALRSHEHQRFVRGDAEQPCRKARLAAERSETAEHLHERRLDEIATIFVGHGITHQLFLDVRPELPHQDPLRLDLTRHCPLENVTFDAECHDGADYCERRTNAAAAKSLGFEPHGSVGRPTGAMSAGMLEHPLPAGMRDLLPEETSLQRALARDLLARISLHGYALVRTPPFELADVLEQGLGALDPADVIRFVEPDSGEVAALRPDMTPQIARMIATRLRDRTPPHRLAYEGTVLRRRAGGAHPRRQIPQVGVELAGAGGLAGDLELLEVLVSALRGAGLEEFTIDVGDSGIVRGLLHGIDPGVQHAISTALAQRDETLVAEIARTHAIDAARLLALLRLRGDDAALDEARRLAVGTPATESVERLAALATKAKQHGLAAFVGVDLGEVRGFAYYTSTLLHVYAKGPGRAIAGGGRYDDLLARFGAPMPAVGFAIDLDALAEALRVAGMEPKSEKRMVTTDPALAKRARAAGIACALHGDPATLEAHAKAWGYAILRSEADLG